MHIYYYYKSVSIIRIHITEILVDIHIYIYEYRMKLANSSIRNNRKLAKNPNHLVVINKCILPFMDIHSIIPFIIGYWRTFHLYINIIGIHHRINRRYTK